MKFKRWRATYWGGCYTTFTAYGGGFYKHFTWRHDTQHNDTQRNGTQHNDTQHNDIKHNDTA